MIDFSGYLQTFWGPATDNPNIPNYSTLDGTNAYGYLDGVAKPFITEDYKKWTAGALSDFNGKENSKYLDSSETNYIGYKLKKQNEELEEGYNDWYIPACGQMGLIYLYLNDINKILVSIGQSAKTVSNVWEYYWTSTEYGQYDAYAFSFFHTKKVGSFDKDTDNFSYKYDAVTMFVRDIITEE